MRKKVRPNQKHYPVFLRQQACRNICVRVHLRFEFQVEHSNLNTMLTMDQKWTLNLISYPLTKLVNEPEAIIQQIQYCSLNACSKSSYRSHAMRCFYETVSDIWAGLGQLGSLRVCTTLLSGTWLIVSWLKSHMICYNLNLDSLFANLIKCKQVSKLFRVLFRGTIGGKTGKNAVLPEFCKIERSGGSGGMPPCYRGLYLAWAHVPHRWI
jgi:hypothetical protein